MIFCSGKFSTINLKFLCCHHSLLIFLKLKMLDFLSLFSLYFNFVFIFSIILWLWVIFPSHFPIHLSSFWLCLCIVLLIPWILDFIDSVFLISRKIFDYFTNLAFRIVSLIFLVLYFIFLFLFSYLTYFGASYTILRF